MPVRSKVDEARSLRDHGFFLGAGALFDQILAESPGDVYMRVSIEAAGMNIAQGLTGRCMDRLSSIESRIDRENLDRGSLAVFDLLRATSNAFVTGKLEDPLRSAVAAYNATLRGRAEAEYDNDMIIVASSYHSLLAFTRYLGYQPEFDLPSFSVAFQSSLSLHLLLQKRFEDAFKIATLSNFSEGSFDNSELMSRLLADGQLPELLRAEALWYYGDKLRQTTGGDEWEGKLADAAKLYEGECHATGALEIRVDMLRHKPDGDMTMLEPDTEELWHINETLQKVGNWRAALQCLAAIVHLNSPALRPPSAALKSRVQEEWVRLTQLCGSNEQRMSMPMLEVLGWQAQTCTSARDLEFLESFWVSIADLNAPNVIFYVLEKLHRLYTKIGATDTALTLLARRPNVISRANVVQAGLDPFDAWLEARTKPADDANDELALLDAELKKVQGIIEHTADVEGRVIEVRRLRDIASTYVGQCRFRGKAETERATDSIFRAIDKACATLGARRAAFWAAETLLVKAALCFGKTGYSSIVDEALQTLSQAANYQKQAVELFEDGGHLLNAGMAKTTLGITHRRMWLVNVPNPESAYLDFRKATGYLAEGMEAAERYGPTDLQRKYCHMLVETWYERFCEETDKIQDDTIDLTTFEAYLMTVRWLNKAEEQATNQRNDLSVLPRKPAVLGMQLLQGDEIMQSVHRKTFFLFNRAKNSMGIWNWIQKRKSRSLSTMLALGINLPMSLQKRVDADTELVNLLHEERTLAEATSMASAPDETWHARNRLQAHRDKMGERPLLREVLDIREGKPVTQERLLEISGRASPDSTRKLVYVDWTFGEGKLWAYVLSGAALSRFACELDIYAWKSRWAENCKEAGGNTREKLLQARLAELSGLVQSVVDETEAGDVLVFCPTNAMYGVPLHAATVVVDGAACSLIERNPVVYTASMTSFAHCVAREADRGQVGRDLSWSFASIYERTRDGKRLTANLKLGRDDLYRKVREAARSQRGSLDLAGEATKERIVSALQADCMLFIGHCGLPKKEDGSEQHSVLHQGLEIAGSTGSLEDPDTYRLTTSEFFEIHILASNVILLACSSAEETHTAPAEPFGLISGLLCAGASSVIGTLWDIRIGTAKGAMDSIVSEMKVKEGDSVIDLAVVVQNAVLELKERPAKSFVQDWASLVLLGSWFMSPRVPSDSTKSTSN